MDELQQKIIQTMKSITLSDGIVSVNMEEVAQKLNTDIADSQFEKAIEELVHNTQIRYIDSINAEII